MELQEILNFLEETYHLTVHASCDGSRMVSRIDFLREDMLPDLCTLYLCPDGSLPGSGDGQPKPDPGAEGVRSLPGRGSEAEPQPDAEGARSLSGNGEELAQAGSEGMRSLSGNGEEQHAGSEDIRGSSGSGRGEGPRQSVPEGLLIRDSGTAQRQVGPRQSVPEGLLILCETEDLPDVADAIRADSLPPARELFTALNEKLRSVARLQQETNALYRLLYSGQGLDDLVRRAELFLHRPISILDAGYNMIAVSPLMRELPFGIETTDGASFLSTQEVESLRRLQIEHQIYQNNQAFFVQTEDHPDTNWIFCAIRIRHVMSGYVAVCLPDRGTATEHELSLTTVIADICAVEMQKHAFFAAQTGLQYETFLTGLLEERFTDVNMVESRLRLLNRRLGKFFALIILRHAQPQNMDLFHKRQMSALRDAYPNSMSVVYKNNIVMLVNQDSPVKLTEEFTQPLRQFAQRNELKVSVSQPFVDILKIGLYYRQALYTLELSHTGDPDRQIFFSTEALPQYLFSNCDYKGLEIGIHYHIFQLRDYDREYHTDFVRTLRAYLDNDRSAAKTAEVLHIHRSTFFYRIKKIEELLDISITDSHLLFLYELSFKIWDYLSS